MGKDVTLEEITEDTLEDVLNLSVTEAQSNFVSTNSVSIAKVEFPRFGRQVIWLRSAISEGVSKYHFASENATTAILVHVFSRSD